MTPTLAPTKPDWRALYLFNLYRFTVPTVFVTSILAGVSPSYLGQFNERLFLITGYLYSAFATICFFAIKQTWLAFNIQVFGQFLFDILAIMLLIHASGGVSSGLGMLLVVVIAGGSLITEGKTAFFFAAIASLCVLFHVSLADIHDWFLDTNYTHAGLLGTSFFATAFLAHTLAQRIKATEAIAERRGVHLQYLAELNAQIVQHIQSGIIVIDIVGRIRFFNEAALRFLGLNEQQARDRTLNSVAPKLAEQLTNWRKSRNFRSPLFRPATGEADIIATFTELKQGGITNLLILLEDATTTAQRAQELKLASLGRLTASIAHEIRNPLGAISHAGQLLAESTHISQEQHRLTQIIAEHSQRVNTIIENVSQLSKRSPTNTQCFDLHAWLQSCIDGFIVLHDLNHADIVLHSDRHSLTICFDPDQLEQVIYNLCENGLRYSQGTPLLELTISVTEETNRPYLDVQDHGQGMTEKVKAQIFEPFFTTEPKGTGLGLYLAKEICDANQASLQLWSNSKMGCCFRIYFSSNFFDN